MAVKIPVPDDPSWRVTTTINAKQVAISGRWNSVGEFWSLSLEYNGAVTTTKAVGGSSYDNIFPFFAWYGKEPAGGHFYVRDTLARGLPPAIDAFSDGWELIWSDYV